MNKAKKLRKMYRKQIDGLAMKDLKKEIFRLARNRDILGLVVIGESIALVVLLYIVIFH
jgi:hypothetical protein